MGRDEKLKTETKGPEIRTGVNKDGKDIELVAGQSLEIFTDTAIESDDTKITCNYKNLPATVSIGSTVIVGEGCLTLEVTEVSDVSLSKIQIGKLLKRTNISN